MGDFEALAEGDTEPEKENVALPAPLVEGGGLEVREGSPEALTSGQRVGEAEPNGLRDASKDLKELVVMKDEPVRDEEKQPEPLADGEPLEEREGVPVALTIGQREGDLEPLGLPVAEDDLHKLVEVEGDPMPEGEMSSEPLAEEEPLEKREGTLETLAAEQREGEADCARLCIAEGDIATLTVSDGEPVSEREARPVPLAEAEVIADTVSRPVALTDSEGREEGGLLCEGSALCVAHGVFIVDRVPHSEAAAPLEKTALEEAQPLPVTDAAAEVLALALPVPVPRPDLVEVFATECVLRGEAVACRDLVRRALPRALSVGRLEGVWQEAAVIEPLRLAEGDGESRLLRDVERVALLEGVALAAFDAVAGAVDE